MNFRKRVVVDLALLSYHLPMKWQEIWGVLKWVLAALIAGFIGQFGKSLALFLMKRRRTRTTQSATSDGVDSGPKTSGSIEASSLKSQAKIEKKRAKAKLKRLKKS